MYEPHPTVLTKLNYCVPPTNDEALFVSVNAAADGTRAQNFELKFHEVEIENLRGKDLTDYTVDKSGFQFFLNRPPTVTEFTNDDGVKKDYYPEVERVVKELTGGSRVVIYDHTIRRRRPGTIDDDPQKRQPYPHVHVDQTTAASIARVHKHLPPDEVPDLLKKRFQIINLWRPITHTALDWPLALCDYRTVDKEQDPLPTTVIYANGEKGETFNVKYNPDHRWKYLRGMGMDEGVLIKCFDSIQDGSVAVFSPHTAFDDPSSPPDAPYRESIEVRTLVFYD